MEMLSLPLRWGGGGVICETFMVCVQKHFVHDVKKCPAVLLRVIDL